MRNQPASPQPVAHAVAALATSCRTWGELADTVRQCTACTDLVRSRSTVVVGDAPPGSRLVLVGEAPGAQEDATGRPFVGRSGQLLDELLAEAGLDRAQTAVLNVVKCRPPGNRTPRATEKANCSGWLDRQLGMLGADLICALGLAAMQHFLGARINLASARGRVHEVAAGRVLATYHPSAALRFGPGGAPRAALREDLRTVAALLAEPCRPA